MAGVVGQHPAIRRNTVGERYYDICRHLFTGIIILRGFIISKKPAGSNSGKKEQLSGNDAGRKSMA